MAKQTKRQRKFNASGGVKARLDKGTITNKGKLKKRKKRSSAEQHEQPPFKKKTDAPRDRSNDFMGSENLGDLDMDAFFAKATEAVEQQQGLEAEEEPQVQDEDSSDDDDDDSDKDPPPKKKRAVQVRTIQDDDDSSSSDSDSSDSGSDDEDLDAAEARMKAEMDKMKESDPDFHKYLKENEEALLQFGEHDDEEEEESDDEEEMQHAAAKQERKEAQDAIELTPKLLQSFEKGTFQSHGTKSLKKLVAAYRSACHLADSSQEDEKQRPGESGTTYVIDSAEIYDQLMVLCLERCHEEFHYHLLGKGTGEESNEDSDVEADEKKADDENEESKPLNPKSLEKAARWPDVRPILLSFFRSTLHVMSEAKEPELLTFILKALRKYLRYMTPFPRIAESMLKTLTSLWSAPLDSSPDYQVVRLNSFFRIRQLALTQPFPFVDDCLKKTYLAYAKRAKFGTGASVANALPTLTFMGNCLVELYSLDYHSSYQHAFVYIRQLALHLRTAMQKKSKEAFQNVYCWQYVHCLKLWVAVLANACPNPDSALLQSLVYPLVEVILGTVRLIPSPTRHLPLRFHCVRLLQQLAASAQVYIPTANLLLDTLDWKEWYLRPTKTKGSATARGLQMSLLLKLPKDDTLHTHEQLEAGMSELFVLLHRDLELYRYSAGFPEYSIRVVQRLRQFNKETANPRWRTFGRGCVDTCERYSVAAVQARAKLDQAPKDVKQLECLLPPGKATMRERHQAAVDKELKSLEATRLLATKPKEQDEQNVSQTEEEPATKKPNKRKRKKATNKSSTSVDYDEAALANQDVLAEQDEVQEGIDWSDDED